MPDKTANTRNFWAGLRPDMTMVPLTGAAGYGLPQAWAAALCSHAPPAAGPGRSDTVLTGRGRWHSYGVGAAGVV